MDAAMDIEEQQLDADISEINDTVDKITQKYDGIMESYKKTHVSLENSHALIAGFANTINVINEMLQTTDNDAQLHKSAVRRLQTKLAAFLSKMDSNYFRSERGDRADQKHREHILDMLAHTKKTPQTRNVQEMAKHLLDSLEQYPGQLFTDHIAGAIRQFGSMSFSANRREKDPTHLSDEEFEDGRRMIHESIKMCLNKIDGTLSPREMTTKHALLVLVIMFLERVNDDKTVRDMVDGTTEHMKTVFFKKLAKALNDLVLFVSVVNQVGVRPNYECFSGFDWAIFERFYTH